MATLEEQLAALKALWRSGARKVEFADRKIETRDDLKKAIDDLEEEINGSKGFHHSVISF